VTDVDSPNQAGTSLVEALVGMTILLVITAGAAEMLVRNGEIVTREELRAEVQANARNCMARVVSTLRSAGWDPGDHAIPTVALDPDTSDAISQIEAFIDRDGDGVTSGTPFEQVLIRHVGDRVEWRTDGVSPLATLARNITNDADGDGVIEPMFTPDNPTDPRRIVVQITAQARLLDPHTREPIRYTLQSAVTLRKEL
jgi:hypothetical protein